jgi:hypothetical protein
MLQRLVAKPRIDTFRGRLMTHPDDNVRHVHTANQYAMRLFFQFSGLNGRDDTRISFYCVEMNRKPKLDYVCVFKSFSQKQTKFAHCCQKKKSWSIEQTTLFLTLLSLFWTLQTSDWHLNFTLLVN